MGVKWGVLGTAGIARGQTIPGMKLAKDCELWAIAGRDEKKVQAYKDEFGFKKGYVGYDALLSDPEIQAVYIPLPNNIHCEWVIKALEAKKHVLCEKPLAMNADEVKKMFDAARKNDRILMEAYAYLHSPYIASLKKDIQSGLIGNVDFIDSGFITQGYKEDFRLHKELGGGAMYDLGCYCATITFALVDSELSEIKAVAQFEGGVDHLTTVCLKFANGVRASFTIGMALGAGTNGRYDRLYVHGTKGSINSSVEFNQEGNLSYQIFSEGKTTTRIVETPQNYSLEIQQLNRCIMDGEKPLITEEFSLKTARLIDEVLKQIGF